MRPLTRKILVALVFAATSSSALAGEGFGLSPFVGAALGTGDADSTSLSVGLNASYGFNDYLGVGAGYTRIFTPVDDAPDTNLVAVRGILGLPLGPVQPYAATGPGYFWEVAGPDDESGVFWDAAAGIAIDLVVLSVSGEVSFRALDNGKQYVQPGVWANIGF